MGILFITLSFSSFAASRSGEQVTRDIVADDIYGQELSDPSFKHNILDNISNSLDKIVMSRYGDPNVDCYISQAEVSLKEANFLWKDLAAINGALIDKIFTNFDKFLAFIKYFHPHNNDPSMMAGGIYTLKVFTDLAVDNAAGETEIDKESMIALLDIVQGEPFNLQIVEGVRDLVNGIEKIEVSKVSRGKNKGEAQIKVHGSGGDDIKVPVERFLPPNISMDEMPIKPEFLKIEDGANIVFVDNPISEDLDTSRKKLLRSAKRKVDRRHHDQLESLSEEELIELAGKKKYLRDTRIKKLVKGSDLDDIDQDNANAYLDKNTHPEGIEPVYFESEGFMITLDGAAGAFTDIELDEGAILPGIKPAEGRRRTRSFIVSGSGTGLLGAIGHTLAL